MKRNVSTVNSPFPSLLFKGPCVCFCFCLLVGAIMLSCASSTVQAPPPQSESDKTLKPPPPAETPKTADAKNETNLPPDLRISDLTLDPDKEVRIKGQVIEIVGMRMVPPKVIFKVYDGSETVMAVINEQLQLNGGEKMELVGKYMEIPSPMHTGPDEAPKESVFVVERYLILP